MACYLSLLYDKTFSSAKQQERSTWIRGRMREYCRLVGIQQTANRQWLLGADLYCARQAR
jgi:hypothetical protein